MTYEELQKHQDKPHTPPFEPAPKITTPPKVTEKKAKAKKKHAEEPKAKTEAVSREEVVCVLRALTQGQYTDGRGNVCRTMDEGVYCQFNRPETDGSDHFYFLVPDTFDLETFEPKG